jgi:hypothetical protein
MYSANLSLSLSLSIYLSLSLSLIPFMFFPKHSTMCSFLRIRDHVLYPHKQWAKLFCILPSAFWNVERTFLNLLSLLLLSSSSSSCFQNEPYLHVLVFPDTSMFKHSQVTYVYKFYVMTLSVAQSAASNVGMITEQ